MIESKNLLKMLRQKLRSKLFKMAFWSPVVWICLLELSTLKTDKGQNVYTTRINALKSYLGFMNSIIIEINEKY